jgi:hypothetical protein
MPGNFDAASTRATELPTVPKPSSAILTVGEAEEEFGLIAWRNFPGLRGETWGTRLCGISVRGVLRGLAISVFDLTG